jgi:hypothetical protein
MQTPMGTVVAVYDGATKTVVEAVAAASKVKRLSARKNAVDLPSKTAATAAIKDESDAKDVDAMFSPVVTLSPASITTSIATAYGAAASNEANVPRRDSV